MTAALMGALLAVAAAAAAAQQVQRCEAADGMATYVNGTCPAGTRAVRTLPAAGTPNAADRQAAQQRARQDAGKVAALERDRKAEEARAARERQRSENEAKKKEAHCRRLSTNLRQAQEDLAGAALNKRSEAQRRVKRAEELFAEDCGTKPQ